MNIKIYTPVEVEGTHSGIKQYLQEQTGFGSQLFQSFDLEEITNDSYCFQENDIIVIQPIKQGEQTLQSIEQVTFQFKMLDYQEIANELMKKSVSLAQRVTILLEQLQQTLSNSSEWISTIQKALIMFTELNMSPNTQQQQTLQKVMKNEIQYIKRRIRLRHAQVCEIMGVQHEKIPEGI